MVEKTATTTWALSSPLGHQSQKLYTRIRGSSQPLQRWCRWERDLDSPHPQPPSRLSPCWSQRCYVCLLFQANQSSSFEGGLSQHRVGNYPSQNTLLPGSLTARFLFLTHTFKGLPGSPGLKSSNLVLCAKIHSFVYVLVSVGCHAWVVTSSACRGHEQILFPCFV